MNFFSELKNKAIIIVIIFVVFYVAFAIFYDANQFIESSKQINYYFVIPALLAFTSSILIKSLRQMLFLRHMGIKIPLKQNIIIYLAGLSMLFTPAGMGEMIKSHFLFKKYNHSVSKTLPLVIVERYHDVLAVFCLITIFSIISEITFLTIPIVIIGILLLVSFILVQRKKISPIFQKIIRKVKIFKNLENQSNEFNETLESFSSKKIIFSGWLVGIVAWSFDGLGIFLCFQAFALDFDFLITTVLGLSSILFGALTLIPGGVGVTEVSFVELLSLYGIESSVSSSLALFFRLLSIWFATCMGIVATKFALSKNKFEQSDNISKNE